MKDKEVAGQVIDVAIPVGSRVAGPVTSVHPDNSSCSSMDAASLDCIIGALMREGMRPCQWQRGRTRRRPSSFRVRFLTAVWVRGSKLLIVAPDVDCHREPRVVLETEGEDDSL